MTSVRTGQDFRAGRGFSWVSIIALVALLATGCVLPLPDLPDGRPGASPERPCTVAAVRSCALPYPSNEFAVMDKSTATGKRLEVPDGLFPDSVIRQLGPGGTLAAAFDGADGYSSVTPVIFEMPEAVHPDSVPADGGDVIAVYDITTGERVPIRAEVPAEALLHGAPDTMVVAWPRTRYEFGHTYVARISDAVQTYTGRPIARAAGLDDGGSYATELRTELQRVEGDHWDAVLSATTFTVRSEQNAVGETDKLIAAVRSIDHPVRNLQVSPPWLIEHASAVVTGEVAISDFRDDDGVVRLSNGPTQRWVKFLMVLPERAAGPQGAPVVIYGHGVLVAKETMLVVASRNAAAGAATIGIDLPNHGDRQGSADDGWVLDLASPQKFGRLASMLEQGILDNVSLLMAIEEHLGDTALTVPTLDGVGAPAPQLDTSTILYEGTSLGGVLGASFVAETPEIDGAFLQVAGSGIIDLIFHSQFWLFFKGVVPADASTGDAYALIGAATMHVDRADNANLLQRIRQAGTPLFLVYGVNDGVVRSEATDRMIALADLPLVGRQLTRIGVPFRSTGSDSIPADGSGVAQIWPNSSPLMEPLFAHLAFAEPAAINLLDQWLAQRLAAEDAVGPPG